MPLIKSKSDKAFKSNIAAEIAAGKPQKQAVAIAYSTKNAAKKARGGSMDEDREPSRVSQYKKAKSDQKAAGSYKTAEMYRPIDKKESERQFGRIRRRNESETLKELAQQHSSIGDPVYDLIADRERKQWSQKIGKGKPAPFKDGGGLYANINAKKERIKHEKAAGLPVERMRKVGSKGAPTAESFKQSAKTAKLKTGGSSNSCW